MFAPRYFGRRYFPGRYFGAGGTTTAPDLFPVPRQTLSNRRGRVSIVSNRRGRISVVGKRI